MAGNIQDATDAITTACDTYACDPEYSADKDKIPAFKNYSIQIFKKQVAEYNKNPYGKDKFEKKLESAFLKAAEECKFETRNLGWRITADLLLLLAGILPLVLVGCGRLAMGKSFLSCMSQAGGDRSKEMAKNATNVVFKPKK